MMTIQITILTSSRQHVIILCQYFQQYIKSTQSKFYV
jgi:hypothetical protein